MYVVAILDHDDHHPRPGSQTGSPFSQETETAVSEKTEEAKSSKATTGLVDDWREFYEILLKSMQIHRNCMEIPRRSMEILWKSQADL